LRLLKKIIRLLGTIATIPRRLDLIQEAIGRIEARQNASSNIDRISETEFKVYSQWGEDGIIQHLIKNVLISNPVFVEFGVETYQESNTRFLIINDNWSGLVLDGSQANIDYIKSDAIFWKYNLKADCDFINRDNINDLISRNGLSGEIGLLSIDIDGNDYWVWKEIKVIKPSIIVCEYNSLWGFEDAVSTPYDADFLRNNKHYSNLYYGASIKALNDLAVSKGYSLVAGNSAGNNVFFVRNDLLGTIQPLDIKQAWVQSKFKESRDQQGVLTHLSFEERRALLADMPLINVNTGQLIKVRELV
jgi:hypothetical protein